MPDVALAGGKRQVEGGQGQAGPHSRSLARDAHRSTVAGGDGVAWHSSLASEGDEYKNDAARNWALLGVEGRAQRPARDARVQGVHPQRWASRVDRVSVPQKMRLLHHLQGSEKVDGIAFLVRVGDELGIQLLVAAEADAASLLVGILWEEWSDSALNVPVLREAHVPRKLVMLGI